MNASKTEKERLIEYRLASLERKVAGLTLLVSVQRQMFQRLCGVTAFAGISTYSSSRVDLTGATTGIFDSKASSYPPATVEYLLENILHSGVSSAAG